jgi:hypothetical protein
MNMRSRFLFGVLALAVFMPLSVIAANTPAPAAVTTPYSLTTSPVSLNLSGKPGTTVVSELRVRNDATTKQRIRVSLAKFSAEGEEGRPYISDRGPNDAYFDWATFSPSEFDLLAGEWQTVKVSIAIPASASNGYYYAVRFSRAGDTVSTPGKQTYAGSNVVLVLLDAVNPNAKRSLQALEFTTSRRIYEFLPATFNVRLRNDGTIHLAPAGSVFIEQGSKRVGEFDFNRGGGNILPGTNRIFSLNWDDGVPHLVSKLDENGKGVTKDGKPVTSLAWDGNVISKLRFGQYTAHLVAVYQNNEGQDVPLEAFVSFWVIPWRIILVLLLVLVFMPVGIYATLRVAWKRRNRIQG